MVFSGIVQDMGVVRQVHRDKPMTFWDGTTGNGFELRIQSEKLMDGCYIGCSICVNGTCLTVTEFDTNENWFEVLLFIILYQYTIRSDCWVYSMPMVRYFVPIYWPSLR